ncbi:MAG: hypothetical protein OXP71_02860 [Candidatus Poribacteria bacterium]|nr:hypothetical protein [Candidatus Poribacteria bacterium]
MKNAEHFIITSVCMRKITVRRSVTEVLEARQNSGPHREFGDKISQFSQ